MKEIVDNEMAFLKKIAGAFPRHPLQLNRLFEADGEIISLPAQAPNFLVVKTDGIGEEIREGLYKDPYLIGWMAVTIAASDLAATGADLLGVLLSLQLPQDHHPEWMAGFQQGVMDACRSYATYILGGDTNFSKDVSVTATAIGIIMATQPLLRKPITPGDLLYSTQKLGGGSAFAYSLFFDNTINTAYKPLARLQESKLIRNFATACIDTSDGLFPALSVLGEINGTGLAFFHPLQDVLCAATTSVYQQARVPAWAFLAGPHGEYELLFSIPASRQKAFEEACANAMFEPFLLGEVTQGKSVHFISENLTIQCEPAEIANLFGEAGNDVQHYFELLMQKQQQWTKTKTAFLC